MVRFLLWGIAVSLFVVVYSIYFGGTKITRFDPKCHDMYVARDTNNPWFESHCNIVIKYTE
jgi:hypothetical protein